MRILGALASLICVLWASSTAAQILTLEEIEARALRDRAELAVSRASIARAQAERAVVESKSGPTLGARAEGALAPGGDFIPILGENGIAYNVQSSPDITDPGAFVPRFRYGGVFSGRLTLLDFGRTALGVQAANAAIGAERANMTRAKVELVQRAREAYLRWMEAHQTWQLAERDADVTAARTVSVRELIAEGVRPATDATLSAYDEQVARLRQNRAARAAEAALEALGEIVQTKLPEQSVPDLDVLEVDPAPENDAQSTPPPPPTGDGLTQERDATLGALDLSRQAALSAARAADRAGAPVLDGAMEAGVQGQNTTLFPIYRASVTLTVPIWDGGARTAQAAVHRAEAEELDAQHRVRQLAFDREEQAADRRSRAAVESLRLSLELLAIAEQMLTQAEDHYRSGSDTLERVLAAQRSLVQARREVLTARVETARTRLELRPIKLD